MFSIFKKSGKSNQQGGKVRGEVLSNTKVQGTKT